MIIKNSLSLEDLSDVDLYYNLLCEEDFSFKNKQISVDIQKREQILIVSIIANSLLELKIGFSAVLKSLEIIHKSLEV